jgi:hypothetical protein
MYAVLTVFGKYMLPHSSGLKCVGWAFCVYMGVFSKEPFKKGELVPFVSQ